MSQIVTLVGAGLIGRGWAILFAKAGWTVRLFDSDAGAPARAFAAIEDNLALLEREGIIASASELRTRMSFAASLPQALEGAAWVQESVPEAMDAKSAVFRTVGELTGPEVILASSCSSIPPEEFMAEARYRERCLIAHPFSPPHLIPVVEIVPTRWTSPSVIAATREILTDLGQRPVMIRKPVRGFAVNRLQAAVINEALSLVAEGVISPEDLDACMSQGLGLRWAFIGPFETMDLNAAHGFKDYATKYGGLYRVLLDDMRTDRPWSPSAIDEVERWRRAACPAEADVSRRRLWRDYNLMRLGKLFRGANPGANES